MMKRIFVVFFLLGTIGAVSGCEQLLSNYGNGAGEYDGNGFGNGTG